MGDFYHQFLSSMSGAGGKSRQPMTEYQSPLYPGMPFSAPAPLSMGDPYQGVGYFPGMNDPSVSSGPKSSKGRRKPPAISGQGGVEPVKHRRTRSGCFTCRSRRVKCDEGRPVCERCRKGSRECVYPDPPATKSGQSQGSRPKDAELLEAQQSSSSPSIGEETEDDFERKLETIRDEEEPDENSPNLLIMSQQVAAANTHKKLRDRGDSEPSLYGDSKGTSPTTSTMTSGSTSGVFYRPSDYASILTGRSAWSDQPLDVQKHLEWFSENISHYHYCLPLEIEEFVKTTLPALAVQYEPLLNAVVGFSAYHATLQNSAGKLEDFLHYYNKSVILLLEMLKRKEKHDILTLLTVLQLATIEEYLGDWVNLMGHQKAAFEMVTKIFQPQTVMSTDVGGATLTWYMRFDNFVALMGGFPTDLPREWFEARTSHHLSQIAAAPDSLKWKFAERRSSLHLVTYDMSITFARGSRGQMSREDFGREHQKLTKRLEDWRDDWDPVLTDPQHSITKAPPNKPRSPDDIVDPFAPGILFDFPIFTSTLILAEWHSIMIMHKSQATYLPPEQIFGELRSHSFTVCQYFEALELWPATPRGAMISVQAGIAISALFLPQDERHHMWLRRKFAIIEMIGYIHPLSLRSKMAELFREPACAQWWLPNEEGFSPILQSIRNFADERNAAAVSAQQESIREVRPKYMDKSVIRMDDMKPSCQMVGGVMAKCTADANHCGGALPRGGN